MTVQEKEPEKIQAPSRWPLVRWLGLAGLLVTEVFLLTYRFDSETIPQDQERGLWLLRFAPVLLRLGLSMIVPVFLFGWSDFREALATQNKNSTSPKPRGSGRENRGWWVFLLGHLAALILLVCFTAVVFEGTPAATSHCPVAWVAAWYAAGALTLGLWALAVLGLATWWVLLKRCWKAILLGSTIGGAAWYAGQLMDLLWPPLGWSTLIAVKALLQLVFSDTVFDPRELVIGTEDFQVEIAPQCSGFEGMGLMAVFLTAFLWLDRRRLRFPAAFLLIPIGVAGAWFLNAVRITLLIALGSWGWREVALGGFHTQAGWLFFIVLALGLVILAGRCSWLTPSSKSSRLHAPGDLTLAYLGPFLIALAIAMLGKVFSSRFDWFYPLRVLGAGLVLFLCRHSYGELRGWWPWPGRVVDPVRLTSPWPWKLAGSWPWQSVCLGGVVFGLWLCLVPGDQEVENHWKTVQESLPIGGAYLWLIFRIIGFVGVTPLVEELAFRGYLIRRLTTSEIQTIPPGNFSWLSMVISSGLFGALHQPWLPGMLAGILFALALRSRGRLGDAVLAHVIANGLLAATVLLTGRWYWWS